MKTSSQKINHVRKKVAKRRVNSPAPLIYITEFVINIREEGSYHKA
jgi:hypothetical protein